jgi:NAD-dependent SIR2 family protein deacetylase
MEDTQLFMTVENEVRQAAEAIKADDALPITTRAGMGVDSGLPDFRAAQEFWRAYPVIARPHRTRLCA